MPSAKQYIKPRKGDLIIRKTRAPKSAEEIMAGMKGGEARVGRNYVRKPDFVPEVDDLDASLIFQ